MPFDTLGGPAIDYASTLGDTSGIAAGAAATRDWVLARGRA